ncbi:hypothetical protein LTR66_012403 [Elasticomyces elasticus]|nr:hypothetical protein LTR66_012403 [Elasticomyces elasticus]
MKFGETLRQRSIPKWAHYNVDYDDTKRLIKHYTTPSNGQGVSVPGQGDAAAREREDILYATFMQEHERVSLFVKSKATEIQRRLRDVSKHVRELELRRRAAAARERIPVRQLETYGMIEGEVLKVGDELQALARFMSAQRTAFKKLLKKYKKWTGCSNLGVRFEKDAYGQPGSFVQVDPRPMLDQYAECLHNVRTLYAKTMNAGQGGAPEDARYAPNGMGSVSATTHVIEKMRSAVESNSGVEFDNAWATVPLGEAGAQAVYWVHPDNILELQVMLLQYARSASSAGSSPGSITPSQCTTPLRRISSTSSTDHNAGLAEVNTHSVIVDDLQRFTAEHSTATVSEKEGAPGSVHQHAAVSARWTSTGEAIIAASLLDTKQAYNTSEWQCFRLKQKHIWPFLTTDRPFHTRRPSGPTGSGDSRIDDNDVKAAERVRGWLVRHHNMQPLAKIDCHRSRYVGLSNNEEHAIWAVLESSIAVKSPDSFIDTHANTPSAESRNEQHFPYAVLQVRREGKDGGALVDLLDRSHLVERLRGFSLEYHAVWQTCQPQDLPTPFWVPILSRDIRKMPEPAPGIPRRTSYMTASSQSPTPKKRSAGSSLVGGTGSTSAVEQADTSATSVPEQLVSPPTKSFKKKRRRTYSQNPLPQQAEDTKRLHSRYWSEYDDPENSDDEDAYVIYIDPNEQTAITKLFTQLAKLFKKRNRHSQTHASLEHDTITPDYSSSSDEEESAGPQRRGYGTISTSHSGPRPQSRKASTHAPSASRSTTGLSHLTSTCFAASLAILVIAFVLATTGRRKQVKEVDAGVLFAVASSLLFAVAGVAMMFRARAGGGRQAGWAVWVAALAFLLLVILGCAGLLAWVLA